MSARKGRAAGAARRVRQAPAGRSTYHHGDLPKALVAAAFELIAENGVGGFSVAEAARRTGVSVSAPYRHFADREELLAACALAAYEELGRRFEKALDSGEEAQGRLAAACAAYVRFAAERRPMFEVIFGAGIQKADHADLAEAAARATESVVAAAAALAPDEAGAEVLVQALTGLAQGHATMLLEGGFGEPPEAVELATARTAAACAALLEGRERLFADGAGG